MADNNVQIKLELLTSQYKSSLAKLDKLNKQFVNDTNKGTKKMSDTFSVFAGNVMANIVVGAFLRAKDAVINFVTSSVTEFAEFEQALISVGKTTDLSGQELKFFGDEIRDLSETIPVSTVELLKMAEVAGQLGVSGRKDLKLFTETMAKLQSTTNVSGEEAAKSLARILNVTGEATGNIKQLASSLVQLGNNFELQEDELITMSTELANTTVQFGLTSAEVVGFAGAMKSLGQKSQAGASAIGELFRSLDLAVAKNGDKLKAYAEVMGVTTESLKKSFGENATQTVLEFLEKLGKVPESGGKISVALEKVGLSGKIVAKSLPSLALNFDKLKSSLEQSNTAFKENIALDKEAALAFDTTKSDIIRMNTALENTKTSLAEAFSKEIRTAILNTTDLIKDVGNAIIRTFGSGPRADLNRLTKDIEEQNKKLFDQNVRLMELQNTKDKFGSNLGTLGIRSLNEELSQTEINIKNTTSSLDKMVKTQQELKESIFGKPVDDAPTGEDPEINKLKLKHEKIISLTDEFNAAKKDREAIEKEQNKLGAQLEDDEEFKLLVEGLDKRQALDVAYKAEQLRALGKHAEARKLIQNAASKASIAKKKKDDSDALSAESNTLSEFASLGNSNNKVLATIGKAAAVQQIAIKTPQAVASAIAWGETLGPGGGVIAGGLMKAVMAAQMAQAAGLNFEQGGVVPGTSFTGDNVQANVNSGEMILNKGQQAKLFSMANNGGSSGGNQNITVVTSVELDGEKLGESVSKMVANGLELGEVQ